LRALETLLLTQLADVVGGSQWAALRAGLASCLAATATDRVADAVLKVYSRLLGSSSSHFAVKETYLNLIEIVLDWYRDRKMTSLLPAASVQESSPMHKRLLALINLIVVQNKELPKLWVRQVSFIKKTIKHQLTDAESLNDHWSCSYEQRSIEIIMKKIISNNTLTVGHQHRDISLLESTFKIN
jgi:hypothetical protein